MGVLRHRRFRRQEKPPPDDDVEGDEYEEGEDEGGEDEDDGDDGPSTIIPPNFSSTTTESPLDKAKAIGKDAIEKVPSKYSSNPPFHLNCVCGHIYACLTFIIMSETKK